MKIEDYRKTFYDFSAKASDINRQLAFAGIAVIWIFKRDVGGAPVIPVALIWSLGLIVVGLLCDVAQYLVAAIIWRAEYRRLEKKGFPESEDLPLHDEGRDNPIYFLFWLKIIFNAAAYAVILFFFLL